MIDLHYPVSLQRDCDRPAGISIELHRPASSRPVRDRHVIAS